MLAKELLLLFALVFQGGFLVCFPSDLLAGPLPYKPTYFLSSYLSLLACRLFFCWALLWMGEGGKQGRGLGRGETGTLEHWQGAFPSQPR